MTGRDTNGLGNGPSDSAPGSPSGASGDDEGRAADGPPGDSHPRRRPLGRVLAALEVVAAYVLFAERSFADARGVGLKRVFNRLGPLLALLVVYLVFAVQIRDVDGRWTMFKPEAIEDIARHTVIIGVSAIGMTMVIISAGIDLSAGSTIAIGSVMAAFTMVSWGFPPFLAALSAVVAGTLCGLVNGLLITRLKVVPFIVTLGMLLIVRGVAKSVASSMPIDVQETWLNALLT
ncbi:MAG: ABC transporter permease, partial [Planctomycetota bacterium]